MNDFVAVAVGLDKENPISFEKNGEAYLGYKVMQYDPKRKLLISGANSTIKLPLDFGKDHTMGGAGIFLSNSPEYVVDYYSYKEESEDPDEVVIQYSFNLNDISHNKSQLGDRDPEIGVKSARVRDFISIEDWHKGKRFKK